MRGSACRVLSKWCVDVRVHAERESGLRAIADARHAARLGTVRTAVERATRFDSVPDDLAMTMRARGCECMDGALEAVERARPFGSDHLERLVVLVSADVALRHQAVSIAEDRI